MDSINALIDKVNHVIVDPLIILLFALAVIIFFAGIVQFIFTSNPEEKKKGSRHMLWGVIGMVIMMSVFGIMNFIVSMLESL